MANVKYAAKTSEQLIAETIAKNSASSTGENNPDEMYGDPFPDNASNVSKAQKSSAPLGDTHTYSAVGSRHPKKSLRPSGLRQSTIAEEAEPTTGLARISSSQTRSKDKSSDISRTQGREQPTASYDGDVRSPYDALGVSKTASLDEIKKAHRALLKKFHPDNNPDPAARELFTEVQSALAVLKNAAKRKAWDEHGVGFP